MDKKSYAIQFFTNVSLKRNCRYVTIILPVFRRCLKNKLFFHLTYSFIMLPIGFQRVKRIVRNAEEGIYLAYLRI